MNANFIRLSVCPFPFPTLYPLLRPPHFIRLPFLYWLCPFLCTPNVFVRYISLGFESVSCNAHVATDPTFVYMYIDCTVKGGSSESSNGSKEVLSVRENATVENKIAGVNSETLRRLLCYNSKDYPPLFKCKQQAHLCVFLSRTPLLDRVYPARPRIAQMSGEKISYRRRELSASTITSTNTVLRRRTMGCNTRYTSKQ